MLYLLFTILIITPILIGWGTLLERYFSPLWEGGSSKFFSGILLLTTTWTILSFFISINEVIELSFGMVGLGLFIYSKGYTEAFSLLKQQPYLFVISLVFILFFGSIYPFILDHYGYYTSTIDWISKAGLVKGIANLELILGQMSLWHIFQAGFSHFTDGALRINAVVLLGFVMYIIERRVPIYWLFIPFLFLFVASPSPDLPVIIGALILVNELVHKPKNLVGLWLFSVFIFAIKPIALWMPLAVGLYMVLVHRLWSWKYLAGVFMLGLVIIKNIWCFGYSIFPIQALDLGVSWKPNPELMGISSRVAILKTYDFQYSYDSIQQFNLWEYFYNWVTLEGIKGVINSLFVILLLILIGLAFKKRNRILSIIMISILIKSILVLWFSAQYRFFLEVFFVGLFLMLGQRLSKQFIYSIALLMSFALTILFVKPSLIKETIPSFSVGQYIGEVESSQWLKPSVYKGVPYTTHQIGNLKFNVPRHYPFTFTTPLPAISPSFLYDYHRAKLFPQLIDSDLKKGFIWKPLTEQQQQELKQILETLEQEAL
ncbi:LIC_10190 family membrane protein [Riemerella columbina]|uniref:LIC_10190 family membrane protein n=1 Tax=Riemerella columbina TaxID=103810 RepID=UPI00036902A2|nr:hypothetical protein [Riemerella columbina]